MAPIANKTTASTASHIDIAEIKEDCAILKDGTLRAVLMVSSLNFALKAEAEQQALIYGYMEFLNSFDYPFQIVIQSRQLNMEKYLGSLAEREKEQTNELLKAQMISYREYVKELVELGEIMTKRFYVVIPLTAYKAERKSFFTKLQEVIMPGMTINLSKKRFADMARELSIRSEQVAGQLGSMGLQAARLDTQGLIELYYSVYNPHTAEVQPLVDVNKVRVEQTFN